MTTYAASHDAQTLLAATRRLAQPSRRAALRRFGRRLPLPEDECAALRQRRVSQEAEWRALLRGQRRVAAAAAREAEMSDATSVYTGLAASSLACSAVPSTAVAGVPSKERLGTLGVERCVALSRDIAVFLGPGDLEPGRTVLPLPTAAAVAAQVEERALASALRREAVEAEAAARDPTARLSRLVQLGSRY